MSEKLSGRTDRPLGILGGTFDPVHCAHVQLATDARAHLGLAQVIWIPSGNPPHRKPPLATAKQRLAMVALATKSDRHFVLDDDEARSTAPSYTVNTLVRLRRLHGTRPLVLLLGADAYLGLTSWYRWRELFGLAHIAAATRPGYTLDPRQMKPDLREETAPRLSMDIACLSATPAGSVIPFTMTPLDISASGIRATLASGNTTEHLLPQPVLDYIANNHLYAYQAPH
jgi:nicotinate-nucleotide adenylyltransferase